MPAANMEDKDVVGRKERMIDALKERRVGISVRIVSLWLVHAGSTGEKLYNNSIVQEVLLEGILCLRVFHLELTDSLALSDWIGLNRK